jgi:pimeloyl-ACP methyl ester carboxylesterase
MSVIDIRGVPHYYEWISESPVDEAFRPTKPVMVFLHGWAGSARYWESTARAIAPAFDCLLYDLRGFGRSLLPRPTPDGVSQLGYELETYADDLALLLDRLGLPKIYLNAHSTGASVAVYFMQRYGDRVERAILTCNGIFTYNRFTFEAFYFVSRYVVAFRPSWLKAIPMVDRMFMARFLNRPIPAAERRAFIEDFLMADGEAAMGTVYTAVSKRSVEEMPQAYAQLTIPTLLISGECDQIIPARLGRQAAVLNPAVQHCIIPNTGHFPMLEDAPTYLRELETFLERPLVPLASVS